MRILVAEPDPALSAFFEREFGSESYSVDVAADMEDATRLAEKNDYHAAILDLNMQESGGLAILRRVRSTRAQLPILVLATHTKAEERAQMLDLGADDLMLKPFAFSELAARVRALLRRGANRGDILLRVDDLELSRVERRVTRAGRTIELTPKEFGLLELLMLNTGQPVSRPQIIERVWNLSCDTMTNVVDVYINYLRKKVDTPADGKLIHTVRGVGYRVEARSHSAA
jgi:two-component system, OmpR family, copper resistance phosphate regulon response regulator CusR